MRSELPKAVASLEWAISQGKGRVYVHCTAGLGRAPAVAIAYLFWFCGMKVGPKHHLVFESKTISPLFFFRSVMVEHHSLGSDRLLYSFLK